MPTAPTSPREILESNGKLLSNRDALSIQITTANFRRFVSRSGPVFWFQDRVEEIVLWKRGWCYTIAWGFVYSFMCIYPRMLLILPQLVLLAIMLINYPGSHNRRPGSPSAKGISDSPTRPSPQLIAPEGSSEWYANLQAIQNLMGAISDVHELAVTVVPYLTWATPATRSILYMTIMTLPIGFLPISPQQIFLGGGLSLLCIMHPFFQNLLPGIVAQITPAMRVIWERLLDDLRMEERHVEARGGFRVELRLPGFRTMHIPATLKSILGVDSSEKVPAQYPIPEPDEERMLEVELFENERWVAGSGWKATNLRTGERRGFTRGRDGWSAGDVKGLDYGNVSSNLTFDLSPGWRFVETEDWRIDWVGSWIACGSDSDGWVYTNDSWLNPKPFPPNELVQTTSSAAANALGPGVTRRRRWRRRIYRVNV
ncbi:integral peroxisomal membrane peroxin protein [Rhizoctonia solani]|uniref:Integral peroxisomal membrane peroxin protein n=1 Tax=Rhizoctonia solani TaxID=456999 RepID=A0A8H8NRM0_9AGAM|nr:integral peroxisomal membrane peroxin protein [Rhizoctonia solani]QRW18065.1 integral peroxisomal membrane peroxin protein [Rhizoctonia solani]